MIVPSLRVESTVLKYNIVSKKKNEKKKKGRKNQGAAVQPTFTQRGHNAKHKVKPTITCVINDKKKPQDIRLNLPRKVTRTTS